MKYLFSVFILFSSLTFAENKMMPLEEFIMQFEEPSAGDGVYMSYRCYGLYTMMYALLLTAPQDDAKDTLKDLELAQLDLLYVAERFYNMLTKEEDRDFENNIMFSIEPMAQNYQKSANESWTNTGRYFSKFISSDLKFCKTFVEGFNLDGKINQKIYY